MTEEEAQAWLRTHFGDVAIERLAAFAALVIEENAAQNLISPSSMAQIWSRHILDSAQLVPLAPDSGAWLDIGTGGGFPGMVVALLRPQPIALVEPRRKRAEFLARCVDQLALGDRVTVQASRVETVRASADVISARAVAAVENLLQSAAACAKKSTRWLLPRGRFAEADLVQLRQRWGGLFHVEQSLTDAGSSILVLDRVSRR